MVESNVGSSRSRELRKHLAERFDLDEATVSAALMTLVGAIHERLPHSVEVSLVSWIPETWGFLQEGGRELFGASVRGEEAIEERLVAAGLRADQAAAFVAEWVAFLERRCGRSLAEALRRRVPELARFEAGASAT
ncbi:MAG: hypothetical protein Q9Q40_04450 [Acidobacteriota bacterium]|nr:hypothetical protein [Acidobacteriota bacterium]MDQ7088124.1 hypothetical protein [Acidobacteriota bacterium]